MEQEEKYRLRWESGLISCFLNPCLPKGAALIHEDVKLRKYRVGTENYVKGYRIVQRNTNICKKKEVAQMHYLSPNQIKPNYLF